MINRSMDTKGITLIALVITIIVLLILAGVTISMTLGDDGLIGRAKDAADQYDQAQQNELEMLSNLYSHIEVASNGTVTLDTEDLRTLVNAMVDEKIQASKQERIYVEGVFDKNQTLAGKTNNQLKIDMSSLSRR